MEQHNHYKMLQVDPAAEPEVIAAAYRRLAQKYHPDINSSPGAQLRMQSLNQAYDVLRNPLTRTRYDEELSRPPAVGDQPSPMNEQHVQGLIEAARRQERQDWQQRERRAAARRRAQFVIGMLCVCVVCISATATYVAVARPRWTRPKPVLVGTWDGEWIDPAGNVLSCRFKIRVNNQNDVGGTVIWILKTPPRVGNQIQTGRQATVSVKGSFEPTHRFITMGSYHQDDPYDVININEYRLYLSPDGSTLSGEMYNDGVWEGKLVATRKQ